MKKVLLVMLLIAFAVSAAGCWNRKELDEIAIVMGIALDKAEQDDKVEMTVQVAEVGNIRSQKGAGGETSSKAYWNASLTGNTTFNIIRDFSHEVSRRLYIPHNQMIIISRDLTSKGINQYLDFFFRDHESRLNVYLLIAEGKASDILETETKLENIPAIYISKLIQNQGSTSEIIPVDLFDFLSREVSGSTSPVAPIIRSMGEGEDQRLDLEGMAVFKEGKVVGQLDSSESRGLSWILGKIKSGILVVNSNEETAEIEITRSKSKVTSTIQPSGAPVFHIEVEADGKLGSTSGRKEPLDKKTTALLEDAVAKTILNEMTSSVKKAKSLGCDIFEFGSLLNRSHNRLWKEIKDQWDTLFPETEITYSVKFTLRGIGSLSKPIYPEED